MSNILPSSFCFNDIISKPLIFVSTVIIGVSSAVIFVSVLVHRSNKDKYSDSDSDSDSNSNYNSMSDFGSDSESESESELNKKYEEKYLEKYNKLTNKDLVEDCAMFIEDLTPSGIVKMAYDKNSHHFVYYANKSIPYKYLEVVARLFVIENDCKNIYINYDEELKKLFDRLADYSNKIDSDKEKEEESEKVSENDVFAKLKNYKVDNTETSKKKWIIPERMNQYKHKGNMRDFDDHMRLMSKSKKEINSEFVHLDYSTYKKLKSQDKKTSI